MQVNRTLAQSVAEPAWPIPPGSDIILRHPRRVPDARAIAHLREQLNLAVHAGLDPHFLEHEKKEMH
ncbi:hypothetical protein DOT67_26400 [Ralstonia pseudosolanacearum]|nr:hypothetical protein DOT67_26400 [Ralstonia pseudosolanacearum]